MTQRHPDLCQALFDAAAAPAPSPAAASTDVTVTSSSRQARPSRGATPRRAAPRRRPASSSAPTVATRWCGARSGSSWTRTRPTTYFSGVLVDGADGFPADLQAIGTEGDVHFLVFPQGGGRVRLYLGFGLDQPRRFTGPDGPRAFVDAFRFECMPASEILAAATPVSPCATYANEDAWVDVPVRDGVRADR